MDAITKRNFELLGYEQIKEQWADFAESESTKSRILEMEPILSESDLTKAVRETTQARKLLDQTGLPTIPVTDEVREYVIRAAKGELLTAENIEHIGRFLVAVRRLKEYLERGKRLQISLAYYSDNLQEQPELTEEIERAIRCGRVDDYASPWLKEVRREIQLLEEKIKTKAETVLKNQKAYMADSFVVTRNKRVCLPVKKEWKAKVPGTAVDQSATGATIFMEPEAVGRLREELELLQIEEDNEVRRILYTLAGMIGDKEAIFQENIQIILKLDFIFAKGKLSAQMKGTEAVIHTRRRIKIVKGRHPQLDEKDCIPLDFELNPESRGVIITGPNTGGKTVSIKTVGLFTLMAGSGLHLPCESAEICMRSQVLCDIGDGQNISDNLSTFSAHISNIIMILRRINEESLVILDELGSGTDPAEGMGIAIAILEELRKSGCLFLVTTHYPEVKEYAKRHTDILSARMGFDRENLKPLYRLEIGQTGESCALYIAKRLGLSPHMIETAAREAYGEKAEEITTEILGKNRKPRQKTAVAPTEKEQQQYAENQAKEKQENQREYIPGIQKQRTKHSTGVRERKYRCGDSVTVYPEKKTAIVVKPEDEQGRVLIQMQKQKRWVNSKRIKLLVAAAELYPEDYDFSVIFDSVENRKARHQMGKHHEEEKMVVMDEIDDWK